MLFKLFINATGGFHIFHATKSVVMVIFFSLWLSACSSTDGDNSQENIKKTLLTSDEDIVKKSITKEGDAEKEITQSKKKPAINLYLKQQINEPVAIPANVLKNYQEAISLMTDKKWQQAELLFDQVILAQPQLSGSYVNKAIIAKQHGKLIEAQILLNKAIAANNLNLYAYHLQGKIYRIQGQFDLAEQSYLAALAIWPDFAEAQASMGVLLELYRGRLLDAYGFYRSYLLLRSDDVEVKRWQAGLEIKIKRAGLEIPIVEKTTPKLVEPEIFKGQSVKLKSDDEQRVGDHMVSPSKELNNE